MAEIIQLGRGHILLGNYLLDAYDVEFKSHRADFDLFREL